jgi:hypothetical protein
VKTDPTSARSHELHGAEATKMIVLVTHVPPRASRTSPLINIDPQAAPRPPRRRTMDPRILVQRAEFGQTIQVGQPADDEKVNVSKQDATF